MRPPWSRSYCGMARAVARRAEEPRRVASRRATPRARATRSRGAPRPGAPPPPDRACLRGTRSRATCPRGARSGKRSELQTAPRTRRPGSGTTRWPNPFGGVGNAASSNARWSTASGGAGMPARARAASGSTASRSRAASRPGSPQRASRPRGRPGPSRRAIGRRLVRRIGRALAARAAIRGGPARARGRVSSPSRKERSPRGVDWAPGSPPAPRRHRAPQEAAVLSLPADERRKRLGRREAGRVPGPDPGDERGDEALRDLAPEPPREEGAHALARVRRRAARRARRGAAVFRATERSGSRRSPGRERAAWSRPRNSIVRAAAAGRRGAPVGSSPSSTTSDQSSGVGRTVLGPSSRRNPSARSVRTAPPGRSEASRTLTSSPRRASAYARTSPERPAPTTSVPSSRRPELLLREDEVLERRAGTSGGC